jgi:hypothetical protein
MVSKYAVFSFCISTGIAVALSPAEQLTHELCSSPNLTSSQNYIAACTVCLFLH